MNSIHYKFDFILYFLSQTNKQKKNSYITKMPREVGKSLGRGKKGGPRSGATLFLGKKNGLSHREIMNKRHQKKKKKNKKNDGERKKELLDEYSKLSEITFKSKKTTAREIMEIVEDIKEEGLNDKNYLAIMDELMALHKEEYEKDNSENYSTIHHYMNILNNNDQTYREYQPPSHFADEAAPIISPSGMSAVVQMRDRGISIPSAWAREGGRSGMDPDDPSAPWYRLD